MPWFSWLIHALVQLADCESGSTRSVAASALPRLPNHLLPRQQRSRNPGQYAIGFCAWKPWVILHALSRAAPGDVVVWRDANALKHEGLAASPELLPSVSAFLLLHLDWLLMDVTWELCGGA